MIPSFCQVNNPVMQPFILKGLVKGVVQPFILKELTEGRPLPTRIGLARFIDSQPTEAYHDADKYSRIKCEQNIRFALHKGPVDDQPACAGRLRGLVREAGPLPGLDLLRHRLEVPLHAVHADCEDVHQAKVLSVLRQNGAERA